MENSGLSLIFAYNMGKEPVLMAAVPLSFKYEKDNRPALHSNILR